jgi:hypothetical protein
MKTCLYTCIVTNKSDPKSSFQLWQTMTTKWFFLLGEFHQILHKREFLHKLRTTQIASIWITKKSITLNFWWKESNQATFHYSPLCFNLYICKFSILICFAIKHSIYLTVFFTFYLQTKFQKIYQISLTAAAVGCKTICK